MSTRSAVRISMESSFPSFGSDFAPVIKVERPSGLLGLAGGALLA